MTIRRERRESRYRVRVVIVRREHWWRRWEWSSEWKCGSMWRPDHRGRCFTLLGARRKAYQHFVATPIGREEAVAEQVWLFPVDAARPAPEPLPTKLLDD